MMMKDLPILVGFVVITLTQLVLGIVMLILIARRGGQVRHLG